MAEANFSWFKTASFVGAAVLVVLAFIMIAGGFRLIVDSSVLHGVACIIGGVMSGAAAVWVYNNYQKKSDEERR